MSQSFSAETRSNSACHAGQTVTVCGPSSPSYFWPLHHLSSVPDLAPVFAHLGEDFHLSLPAVWTQTS